MTRLPAAAFVPTAEPDTDPLAAALQEMAGTYYNTKIGPRQAEALLAYIHHVDFDPNAMIGEYGESNTRTALGFLLDKTAPGWRRIDRHWPDRAEDFGPHLLQSSVNPDHPEQCDRVDTEWLAAVLLAVGADPWSPANMAHAPLSGEPLAHALRHGMGGLVRRLLAMPGAPSVPALAAAPVMESLAVAGKESWLHCACRETDVLPLLPWFLDNGARPVPGGTHPLEQGAMQAIEEFAQRGLMPTEPATVRRLESAWRKRLKTGEVSAEEHSLMTGLLRGKAPADPWAAELLQVMSASAWGKSDWQYQAPENIGLPRLIAQASIESGALAGQWNGLGAHLLKHLRTTSCENERGVPRWSLATAVQHEYVQRSGWVDLNPSGHEGALAPALGVEWRPGVRLDGLIALVVLGAESGQGEINEACELLGVSDPIQWGKDCAADAVAFTEALVPKRADKAAAVMASAWNMFLTRCPDALLGHPELARRLLASLHGNFTTAGLPANDSTRAAAGRYLQGPLGRVVARLTGANPLRPPPASVREPAGKALCVELALMFETALWFDTLLSPAFGLEADHLDRIQQWAQARLKEADAGGAKVMAREDVTRVLTRAREAVLTARLPPAAPRTARPRM